MGILNPTEDIPEISNFRGRDIPKQPYSHGKNIHRSETDQEGQFLCNLSMVYLFR
jgi:hypothetical protein